MTHATALRYCLAWLALAIAVELYGAAGYAVHAGYLGGWLSIGTGPVGPFRALIVYDGVEQPINSAAVIHYLRTHCIKGPKDTAEYRQWNKDVDATNESDEFKRLDALPHESYPWVAIEHASGRPWSGPLPKSSADQLALFKKWGGE